MNHGHSLLVAREFVVALALLATGVPVAVAQPAPRRPAVVRVAARSHSRGAPPAGRGAGGSGARRAEAFWPGRQLSAGAMVAIACL